MQYNYMRPLVDFPKVLGLCKRLTASPRSGYVHISSDVEKILRSYDATANTVASRLKLNSMSFTTKEILFSTKCCYNISS